MLSEHHCDVVVVGGSLVGSAAAMFLAQHGLSVCLLERRTTVSPHPRARGISVRTMELYRAAGIEPDIRRTGEDDFQFVIGDTLAGPHQPGPRMDAETMSRLSPTTQYSCDQSKVEPILRRRAEELGATSYLGCVAAEVEHLRDQVTVLVSTAPAGHQPQPTPPRRITAHYLVAADGANSTLRGKAGIGRHGQDVPGVGMSALFDADLTEALDSRRVSGLIAPREGAVLFPKGTVREHHWFSLTPRPEFEKLNDGAVSAAATSAIRSVVGDPTSTAATPGMRVPHVRLRGPAVSTLDLLDPCGFTMLTAEGSTFAAALESRPVPGVRTCVVRQQDILDAAAWHRLYGNSRGVLIRPDAIVGWRTDDAPSDPRAAVAAARARCLTKATPAHDITDASRLP